jgi:hypothetical protein
MKKIAVIGSRNYPHLDRVRRYVEKLEEGTIVVTGGARGVDKTAGFKRNTQIVNDADVVVAFWDGTSRGSLDTITKAVKCNKTVIIFGVKG